MSHAALGEAASRDLVEVLNTVSGAAQDRVLERMDQRFADFQARLDQTAAESRVEIVQVRTELRAEIESKVSRAEARLIKWAFAFWASGVTAIVVAILLK